MFAISAAVTALLSAALYVVSPGAAAPAQLGGAVPTTCHGYTATIVGTTDDDEIEGTSSHDVIVGGPGHDRIDGAGGADVICGGDDRDVVNPGSGRDLVFGGADFDNIFASTGNDVLHAGAGGGELDLYLTARGARLDVAAGTVRGGTGRDAISGFTKYLGTPYADVMLGGPGADYLVGGGGGDTIRGSRGADTLDGEEGDDLLVGGDGDDIIYNASSDRAEIDRLVGGPGNDLGHVVGVLSEPSAVVHLGPGADHLDIDSADVIAHTGSGPDLVTFSDLPTASHISTGGGNDVVDLTAHGTAHLATSIALDSGNDRVLCVDACMPLALIRGGDGRDVVDMLGSTHDVTVGLGETGTITTTLEPGSASEIPTSGFSVALLGSGDDQVVGLDERDFIAAGAGDDDVDAGGGRDTVSGGPGTDRCLNAEVVTGCEVTS